MKMYFSILLVLHASFSFSQHLEVPDFTQLYKIEWVSGGESTVFVLMDEEGWHLFEMEPIRSGKLQNWFEAIDFKVAKQTTAKVVGGSLIGELILESKPSDSQDVISIYLMQDNTYLATDMGSSKTYQMPSGVLEKIRMIEKLYGDGE